MDEVTESGKTARILVCGKLDAKWFYNKLKTILGEEMPAYDVFCKEFALSFYSTYGLNVYLEKPSNGLAVTNKRI